jgi:hypothetical protein
MNLFTYVEVAAYLAGFNSCTQQQQTKLKENNSCETSCVYYINLSLSLQKRSFDHQKGERFEKTPNIYGKFEYNKERYIGYEMKNNFPKKFKVIHFLMELNF